MADSILRDKSKEFAKQIVFLCRDIKTNMKESVLSNQLFVPEHLLGQTFTKHNMHKEQRILYPSLK